LAGDVVAALGYTPYDAANPAGYLNAINAAQVIDALGYNPVAPAGTFAVGTWNISISGNAATATTAASLAGGNMVRARSGDLGVPAGTGITYSSFASATVSGGTVPARAPDVFQAYWKCISATGGYSVGDLVQIAKEQEPANFVFSVGVDTTQWWLNWAGNPGNIREKGGNPGVPINAANWRLVFSGVWLP
jgi:hypothetical protein